MSVFDITAMGEDSLGNYFNVVLPSITSMGAYVGQFNQRITSASIPDFTIDTYEIVKRGRHIEKVKADNGSQSHEVTIEFRGDKLWHCYNAILTWMKQIKNNETLAMSSDGLDGEESEFRCDIPITAINNLSDDCEIVNQWTLLGAFPKQLSGVEFGEENTDPTSFTVTFTCNEISYPTLS